MEFPLGQEPIMKKASRVELQIMWNRLLAVVEEQAQVLLHTAFSPIVRECGDISAGIFDRHGRMLAQAVTGTPGHINTMAESVRYFIDAFTPETMAPGDVFLTNDPWLASGHLNDFMLVEPAFLDDVLVGFVACTSHLIDLGGLGMGPEGSDVFDEGLLVPPCRLVERGDANELLIALIKANSRSPVENEGDIYALIACCDVGATRLSSMMREFGLSSLEALSSYVIDTSRRATHAAIAQVPNGTYRSRMHIDGYDFPIELSATLHVGDHDMLLDLDGSSPCSRFGINVPLNYTTAYSVFGIRCIVSPEVPNNAGSLAPFRVTAPLGCIVNAPRPAPVAMRHTIGQLMPDLVLGCLHQAIPWPGAGGRRFHDVGSAVAQRVRSYPPGQRHHVRVRADPQRRHRSPAGRRRALRDRLPERGVGVAGRDHGERRAPSAEAPGAAAGLRRSGRVPGWAGAGDGSREPRARGLSLPAIGGAYPVPRAGAGGRRRRRGGAHHARVRRGPGRQGGSPHSGRGLHRVRDPGRRGLWSALVARSAGGASRRARRARDSGAGAYSVPSGDRRRGRARLAPPPRACGRGPEGVTDLSLVGRGFSERRRIVVAR